MTGDLLCRIVVETPTQLTERQRELLLELQQSFADRSQSEADAKKKKGFFDKVSDLFD
jgi:molecular chaperone DnaJ